MKRHRTETKRGKKVKSRKQARRQSLDKLKRRIERRLDKHRFAGTLGRSVFAGGNVQYELSQRTRGLAYGGIGLVHEMARQLGLPEAINQRLHLFKINLPYRESDHVLNIAYNALCDGHCLEDIELRRNDEVYLDALGAERIPDPTTAGDFCRRFRTDASIRQLQEAINDVRLKVWARQPAEFFRQAVIDMDGTMVETTGECKQGMDISYKGVWGYHPLVVTLANTGEVLSILNRSGNRPSHEGASGEADRAIELCRAAGFQSIKLRGDTDFSQTAHLDRWDAAGVQFLFGMDVIGKLHVLADDLSETDWMPLERRPHYEVKTKPRRKPENVKERIVEEREFKNIELVSEEVAEFDYRPTKCRQAYRMIVVRKNTIAKQGQLKLFDDYRYFLYITNDRDSSAAALVFEANHRCNQERHISQLKTGVRALRAPVDNLHSNWAYMVMTALAWNLKAWWALLLPEEPGRWQQKYREEKQRVLKMEFQTFVNAFLRIPCQLIRTGRRLVFRVLNWNRWHHVFFRMADVLRC